MAQQDSTDFDKCLDLLARGAAGSRRPSEVDIVVLAAFGGRLDQTAAIINSMHIWSPRFRQLMVINDECDALVLPRGRHAIRFDEGVESTVCGLLPVGSPSPGGGVRTTGLRWNLGEDSPPLRFGGLISTSNERTEGGTVEVQTEQPLVFTCAIRANAYEDD